MQANETLSSRERVRCALEHREVDRFPRTLRTLPNVNMFKADRLRDFHERYKDDMTGADMRFGESPYARGVPNRRGSYTDDFGCQWVVAQDGVIGEVKQPIFADWRALDDYRMPWALLDGMDLSKVNESRSKTDCFVLASTHIRPFERMQFMRGTEELFVDIAMGEPQVERLLGLLHEFYLKELELIADTDVDGISFMDDWGSQQALLISPKTWRQMFKPLYRDYCDLMHAKGKYVFFHSDGNIEAIFPDMIELGVDAVNAQLFCMDPERLVERFGDRITFWGEIDRQFILPFGTQAQVRAAVDRVADAVVRKNGRRTGAIAQCEYNAMDPYENILAVFDQWDKK